MTFDPNEQRDAHGRWATGGGVASGEPEVVERHLLDQRVLDVSGDEWNKKTAERLEKEYAAVRPEIDAIATAGVEKGTSATPSNWAVVAHPSVDDAFALQADNGSYALKADGTGAAVFATKDHATAAKSDYAETQSGSDDEEEEGPTTPQSWDDLSGLQQEEAEQHYIDSHIDNEKEYAVTNWQENGGGLYDAKHLLEQDDDFKSEWLSEFLAEREEEGAPPIPFKADDLLGAINIKAGDEYDDDPEITFDEKYLDSPQNFSGDKSQLQLPGIEPQNPSDFLTKAMREDIEKSLIEAFNDKAKDQAENIDPPSYLYDEADESVKEAWSQMDYDDQFKYAMENLDDLKDAGNDVVPVRAPSTELAWPSKFDPLNMTSGTDYTRTQALAKYIADKRGAQLITERVGNAKWKPRDQFLGSDEDYAKLYGPGGVGAKKDEAWTARIMRELQSADLKLWSGWKGSSTNAEGRLLQVASADELGGRIREAKPDAKASNLFSGESTVAGSKYKAKLILSDTGDYYLPELKAAAQKYMDENKFSVDDDVPKVPELNAERMDGGYIRLPDVTVQKNGAASTTVSAGVANGWNGTTNNAPEGINKKESIEYANKAYAAIGGYEGVKAALRAKWETTQYLLDRADVPVVQAYRGINLAHKLKGVEETGDFNPPANGIQVTDQGTKTALSNYKVGDTVKTQSGKTITKVSETGGPINPANPSQSDIGQWKFSQAKDEIRQRVVLRAEVPRTAVVSVPAYGVNVKSEQEVVVAGAAWKGWDAWSGRAPTFERIPMHHKADAPKSDADERVAMYESMKKTNGLSKSDQAIYDELKKAQS